MALSMEEQRILAEIEQELARSEPALAVRLSTFSRPSPLGPLRDHLRSPRVLVVASVVAVLLLTVVPVVVYALVSLRGMAPGRGHAVTGHAAVSAQHHAAPVHPVMSAPH